MRPIVVIFALFAVVMAGLAAFLAKTWLDSRTPQVTVQQVPAPAKPINMVQILVAAKHIDIGTKLTQDDIRWANWPKEALEDRFIEESEIAKTPPTEAASSDDAGTTAIVKESDAAAEKVATVVVGALARRAIMAGEPIGVESIIQPGDRSIVAAILPAGMRAISIPISVENAAAGFITPGDHVDVLLAFNVRNAVGDSENKKADIIVNWSTETILHDVKVLAIDQQLSHDSKEGPAVIGKSATLEISPADAERLLAAQQLGSLSLVLRSFVTEQKTDDVALDDSYDDPMLFTTDKEVSKGLSALAGGRKGAGIAGDKVRVNRGGALSEQGF